MSSGELYMKFGRSPTETCILFNDMYSKHSNRFQEEKDQKQRKISREKRWRRKEWGEEWPTEKHQLVNKESTVGTDRKR